jgi:hypothetical protein
MLLRVPRLSFAAARLVLALLSVASFGALCWGQGGDLNDGLDQLGRDYRRNKDLIHKLFKGEEPADPKNAQHEKAVDLAARNVTFYYTDPSGEKKAGEFDRLFTSFEGDLTLLVKARANSPALPAMYGRRVIARAQEVLFSTGGVKPIARVDVTRVLARLAERGQNESTEDVVARLGGSGAAQLADALLKALAYKNDGVKYHALHGLRDLLAIPPQKPPLLTPEVEQKCALALIEFVEQKPSFPAIVTPPEVEGFRVLRREAIKALAQYRAPSIKDKARPALVLLKVVARDGFQPDCKTDERVEAAIGVARMKPDLDKTYQPEYAAQQLGLFLVDFAYRYQKRDRAAVKYPWAVMAARLTEALQVMKAESKSPYVARIVDQGIKLALSRIEANGDIDANEVTKYAPLLLENAPSLGQLFSGVEGTTVPSPFRPDDVEEKPNPPGLPPKADKPAEKPAKP